MNGFLDKLFKGAQKGATNVASRAIDLFEQQADEQDREATVAEKAGKTIGDFFEPEAGKVRTRDVVRELPEGFASVVGRPILRSFAALGTKASNLDPRATYVPETPYEKDLFGTDDEISFTSIGKETRLADPDDESIPVLDPVLGGFIAMADAASGGRAKPLAKGVSLTVKQLRGLSKADDVAEITKTLRQGGMSSRAAKEAAPEIAKVSKQSDVENIIKATVEPPEMKSVGDILSGTKATRGKAGETPLNVAGGTTQKKFLESFSFSGREGERLQPHTNIDIQRLEPGAGEFNFAKLSDFPEDSQATIKNIADNFDPNQFDPVVVTRTKLGWQVEDGAHRLAALRQAAKNGNQDAQRMLKEVPVLFDDAELKNIWRTAQKVKKGNVDWTDDATSELIGDLENMRLRQPQRAGRAPVVPKRDERRFITRTRAMEPRMNDFLEGKKATRSTDELAAYADNLIDSDIDEAIKVAKEGTDDRAVAVASRLIDKYVTEAGEATSDAARTKLWEAASEIANDAAKNLTEHGRAVQAASLLGRTTPEGMVRFAARSIQQHNEAVRNAKSPVEKTLGGLLGTKQGKALKEVPELTGEQMEDIVRRMKAIEDIDDEVEKAMELKKLQDEIRSYIPSSLYQKIVNVWKAGLLTGLKTTGLNIASNTAHFGSEIVKDVPATVVDKVASLFTGKRTLGMTTKGIPGGIKEGAKKGWRYWRTGFDERDIGAKLDYKKINFGNSRMAKAIQTYEETVFQTIGAQDQPFYYASKARSLASQAIAESKNMGLKGKDAKEFVEKMMANPTDEMLKYAVLDAETAVFTNKTTLGKAARAIQNLPGGQIVLPFGKTPSAVATQIINYSPVGVAKTIIENIGKGKFDQRTFSQGLGRGLSGTGVVAIGMSLFADDKISLGYPTSRREREQWELEGKRPNSIYMDGEWRNVGVLGPAGLLLIIGGHMQNGIDETGSTIGGLAASAAGFGNTLTEQSFLKGINQAIEAIQDPERSFEGFASSLAGSVVPTIIADISRSMDPYERQTSGPAQRFVSRLPVFREGLEPRISTLGNKIEAQDPLTTLLDATRPGNEAMREEDRPIVEELRRLGEAGYPSTPTDVVPRDGFESLTEEENTYLRRLSGTAVRDAIQETMDHPSYGRADDEQKEDVIDDRVQAAKVEARARAVLNATEGLEGRELTRKLAQMKQDRLLTKQVYNRYQSLKRQRERR